MTQDAAILLLVIALLAIISPAIGRRLGIPAAVVEILLGAAAGMLGLSGSASAPFIRFLADLGFALFLFLAGMEVDAHDLRRGGGRGAILPLVSAGVSFALAFAVCFAMGWSPWVAVALGATSVPLLLSIVREAGLSASPIGKGMVTAAAVGEVLTIALVAVGEIVDEAHGVGEALLGFLRLVGMLALVIVGTRVLAVLRWWFPDRARGLLGESDVAESGVRAGFGLTFVMIAAAALAGVEPLLGAFVGGLMVAFAAPDKHAIEQKFGPMAYGFFVPVFFVSVGLRLDIDPKTVVAELPRALALACLMLLVKLLPTLAGLFGGQTWRVVAGKALLLAAPLTLVIAIADLAIRLGAIDDQTQESLVLAAMFASVLFPSLARRVLPQG